MRLSLLARERIFASSLLIPCFVFVIAFAFYPIFYSLFLSLHKIILSLPYLGSPFVGLDNYKELLGDRVALHSLFNTLIFVFATTILEILFGLVIALVINRHFKGRGIVRAAVLIPWAIPTVVSSQMWRFIFNDQYGLLNYMLYGSNTSVYTAWLADPATAEIDGATSWQQFREITLPLIKPAILIALLFRTMDAFRVFDLVFVMTQGGPADSTNVLQFYGYKKIFAEGRMGYGSTISVLVFFITFIISMIYIRTVGTRLFQEKR